MGTLAERIAEAREGAKLTQKQLARKCGITQSAISRLESGLDKETAHLVKIAVATGYSPFWLDSERGPKKMGELETALRNLDAAGQRAAMAFVRAFVEQEAG